MSPHSTNNMSLFTSCVGFLATTSVKQLLQMSSLSEKWCENPFFLSSSTTSECEFRRTVGLSQQDDIDLLLLQIRTIVCFQANLELKKRTPLRGVSLENLIRAVNNTFISSMSCKGGKVFDEIHQNKFSEATFFKNLSMSRWDAT